MGFYYHYKHDEAKGMRDYAYFIYGVGHHTEDNPPKGDELFLNYQPLYEAFVYVNGKMYDNRPLDMFYEPAEWQGKTVGRFTRITDADTIRELQKVHRQMYPELYEALGVL